MVFELRGRFIFFATNNVNKFDEARRVLDEYKMSIGMLRVKHLEIQSQSLEEIAKKSVLEAFRRCDLPLIVEDAGLLVEALNGFPGPYAAYVYETIGNKGLLKLMKNLKNRKAEFRSVIAYHSAELKSPICFRGKTVGEMIREERKGSKQSGFGFDPIFSPVQSNKTFAEMTIPEKNRYSHRAQALRKFAEWYKRPL
jgi:XTP/dITP diphosphohydrolase